MSPSRSCSTALRETVFRETLLNSIKGFSARLPRGTIWCLLIFKSFDHTFNPQHLIFIATKRLLNFMVLNVFCRTTRCSYIANQ